MCIRDRVNQPFEFTVVTTGDVKYIRLFNENGAGLIPASAVPTVNDDGTTTWNCTMAVGSAGSRTFTVKVAGADRVFTGDLSFSVNIG